MRQPIETKHDLLTALQESRHQLRDLGVKSLGLFGSFLRGEQQAASDVDLVVEFEAGQKTFDHYMQLAFLLEDILQRTVQVLTPESLSPHLGPHILSEVEHVPITP